LIVQDLQIILTFIGVNPPPHPSPLPPGERERRFALRILFSELYLAAPFLLPLREKDRIRGESKTIKLSIRA
jgi:hypothetical protein